MTERAKLFSTSDIQIAATMVCMGEPLVDITRSGNNFGHRPKAIFHFNDSESMRKLLIDYTNNALKASPRDLFARFKELKSTVVNMV